MCMLAVMRDRHMHLAQVNRCYLLDLALCYWLLLLIGGYGFVLRPCRRDDPGMRPVSCPIQEKRCVATAVGQSELAILEAHSGTFVLDTKVPLAAARWMCIG